ncbi:MAG: DNA/RNA non-specific endonuclease, partial [Clostridia bacterium]|nr:DNA/RNA non-specific endonuclease [Clostridia bacterium]
MIKRLISTILAGVFAVSFCCSLICSALAATSFTYSSVEAYSGSPYAEVNGNVPEFVPEEYTVSSFETYSELDELGRCGEAYACVGTDIMPTEPRGSISSVTPTGWINVKYETVSGGYLYNRCHLIGFQLTGENANPLNLITGTRYLNVNGMLPFEDAVADYVKSTDCHVLYRVTPVFEGDELVARGVLMEALSMEDGGAGVCFCVFCYNVQPGVAIDYATGASALEKPAGRVYTV